MKNGLYSIHMHMLDGVRGRDSGILILRDGVLIGGGPYFWSVGSYTLGDGTWKGQLTTNQHTPFSDPFVRPWAGSQQRIFRDVWQRPGRGVRHRFGGNPQPQLQGDLEEARR